MQPNSRQETHVQPSLYQLGEENETLAAQLVDLHPGAKRCDGGVHARARRRSLWWLLFASCALHACQATPAAGPRDDGDVALDARAPSADLPGASPFTMLVVLGDSVAYGFGIREESRFDNLLLQNDDRRYPEFSGRDLISRYPDAELLNVSESGANSARTVIQALSVPPNPRGPTLVIISLGPTEFADNLFAILDEEVVAAVAARLEANLERILSHFARPSRYPDGAVIGLFSVLDPTDAMGMLPLAVDDLYCNLVAAFSKTGNLQRYNAARERFAQAHGVLLLDTYEHFLGHGYFFSAPGAPHHDPGDPSLWFQLDCLHPNPLGHHQLRRLIWDEIFERPAAPR